MSIEDFNFENEIRRLIESDDSSIRSLGEWMQSLSNRPTVEDRRRFMREIIMGQVSDFENKFNNILTSNGENHNEFHGINEELFSFSLKDLIEIKSVFSKLDTRFFSDNLEEELVVTVISGSLLPDILFYKSYTYRAMTHSVSLADKSLDSDNCEDTDKSSHHEIVYIFNGERLNIVEFLHSLAWIKYSTPTHTIFFELLLQALLVSILPNNDKIIFFE